MAAAMAGAHQCMQEAIMIGAIARSGSTGIVVRIIRCGMQIRPMRGFMQIAQRSHHRLADHRQQQQPLRQMAQATSGKGQGAGGHRRQG
jgi:histidine ammonia-lyase